MINMKITFKQTWSSCLIFLFHSSSNWWVDREKGIIHQKNHRDYFYVQERFLIQGTFC